MAGPWGSRVIEGQFAHYLFLGDETAMPAIGRSIEALPAGSKVTVVVEVAASRMRKHGIRDGVEIDFRWLVRGPNDRPGRNSLLLDALTTIESRRNLCPSSAPVRVRPCARSAATSSQAGMSTRSTSTWRATGSAKTTRTTGSIDGEEADESSRESHPDALDHGDSWPAFAGCDRVDIVPIMSRVRNTYTEILVNRQ